MRMSRSFGKLARVSNVTATAIRGIDFENASLYKQLYAS